VLVNGKQISERILESLDNGPAKSVCFISFGQNAVGKSFVGLKAEVAERLGVNVEIIESGASSTAEAIEVVKDVSSKALDGLVVQLPLPKGWDVELVLNSIPHKLDIDLLSREAKELYSQGLSQRIPPVAGAVAEIIKEHELDISDKQIVILGKGRLVGEPVAMLLDKVGARYTMLDKSTPQDAMNSAIASADILISGIGVPHFIKPEMIKKGAVLIDAGTSGEEGKIAGDVDPLCESKVLLMTPVPGGVGPITVAVLYSNLML
jgi:methylenetetrahydrofolate dehydrogenase (NADP+)/methenyltetrahydrofolate cyclohydrolase